MCQIYFRKFVPVNIDGLVKKSTNRRYSKKLQMQGARTVLKPVSGAVFRNEPYLSYVAMTKDEAQRRRWTFYEVVNILAVMFFILMFATVVLAQGGDEKPKGPPPVPVEVASVIQDIVSEQISLVGTTEAIARSIIAAEVSGLVEKLPVSAGDLVKKGQLLARLSSTRPALRLKAARATRQKVLANLVYATKELTRYTALKDSNSVATGKYDEILYRENSLQEELRRTKAEIDLIKDNIDKKSIIAPFPGFIAEEHTEVGQWAPVGGPIVTIVDLRYIRLVVDVPERYAVKLLPESRVRILVPSVSDKALVGRIYAILPEGNPQARTFPVHVRLTNPEFKIKSGMEARVAFNLGDKRSALVVPKDAIITAGGKQMVFIAADGIVRPVNVKVVGYYGSNAAVAGSLKAGDQVVIRGNERLRPGQPVKIVK